MSFAEQQGGRERRISIDQLREVYEAVGTLEVLENWDVPHWRADMNGLKTCPFAYTESKFHNLRKQSIE